MGKQKGMDRTKVWYPGDLVWWVPDNRKTKYFLNPGPWKIIERQGKRILRARCIEI